MFLVDDQDRNHKHIVYSRKNQEFLLSSLPHRWNEKPNQFFLLQSLQKNLSDYFVINDEGHTLSSPIMTIPQVSCLYYISKHHNIKNHSKEKVFCLKNFYHIYNHFYPNILYNHYHGNNHINLSYLVLFVAVINLNHPENRIQNLPLVNLFHNTYLAQVELHKKLLE